jgi:hypothetical protein
MLVQGEKLGSIFNLLQLEIVFLAPSVEEDIFSPTYILGNFVENQRAVVAWVCVRGLLCYSIGLHVYFSASTILFLLPWLYSIV